MNGNYPLNLLAIWTLHTSAISKEDGLHPHLRRCLRHRGDPAGRRDLGALDLLMDARELAFIQPEAAARRALIDLHQLLLREPAALQHLLWTTRAHARLGERHRLVRTRQTVCRFAALRASTRWSSL